MSSKDPSYEVNGFNYQQYSDLYSLQMGTCETLRYRSNETKEDNKSEKKTKKQFENLRQFFSFSFNNSLFNRINVIEFFSLRLRSIKTYFIKLFGLFPQNEAKTNAPRIVWKEYDGLNETYNELPSEKEIEIIEKGISIYLRKIKEEHNQHVIDAQKPDSLTQTHKDFLFNSNERIEIASSAWNFILQSLQNAPSLSGTRPDELALETYVEKLQIALMMIRQSMATEEEQLFLLQMLAEKGFPQINKAQLEEMLRPIRKTAGLIRKLDVTDDQKLELIQILQDLGFPEKNEQELKNLLNEPKPRSDAKGIILSDPKKYWPPEILLPTCDELEAIRSIFTDMIKKIIKNEEDLDRLYKDSLASQDLINFLREEQIVLRNSYLLFNMIIEGLEGKSSYYINENIESQMVMTMIRIALIVESIRKVNDASNEEKSALLIEFAKTGFPVLNGDKDVIKALKSLRESLQKLESLQN